MPSTGAWCVRSNTFTSGAETSLTEKGDPERITPFIVLSKLIFLEYGMISQYTLASLTARAMSCVYCEPKSRMIIFSVMRCEDNKTGKDGFKQAGVEYKLQNQRDKLQQEVRS